MPGTGIWVLLSGRQFSVEAESAGSKPGSAPGSPWGLGQVAQPLCASISLSV